MAEAGNTTVSLAARAAVDALKATSAIARKHGQREIAALLVAAARLAASAAAGAEPTTCEATLPKKRRRRQRRKRNVENMGKQQDFEAVVNLPATETTATTHRVNLPSAESKERREYASDQPAGPWSVSASSCHGARRPCLPVASHRTVEVESKARTRTLRSSPSA